MSAEALDHVFKILLIGDAGVGKSRYIHMIEFETVNLDSNQIHFVPNTFSCIPIFFLFSFTFFLLCLIFLCYPSSILLQFTDGYFNDNLQSTIGVDFKIKVMDAAGPDGRKKKVKVTIWDTGIFIH
jgi:hypothetical protein